MPKSVVEQVEAFAKERGLSAKEKKELLKVVEEWYSKARATPWEDVGLVAAQSMGEPATQATLRTFHYGGAAEVSVTSGMTRILEIADALRNIKTPIMWIYLNEPYKSNRKKAIEFAKSLEETTLSDVGKVKEDFFNRTITVVLDEKELERKGLDKETVFKKVCQKVGKKGKEKGYTIEFSFKNDKVSLAKLRKLTLALERLHIKGIKGIKHAIVKKDKETGEYYIMTSGTNLKAILKLKEVDHTRTISNDIHEVADVLGIEAARYMIIQELRDAYGTLEVDLRHLSLVADMMTWDGKITPIGRTGIAGRKGSVLARAAFEETGKHLTEAAIHGEEDHLKGVVENLIVGLPVKVGTGRVKLIMKLR